MLIGTVVGLAGMWAPLSFVVAAVIAGLTALSYAELASRFPESAGAVTYVARAFEMPAFSAATGWIVVATGVISAATMASGLSGYLRIFVELSDWIAPMVMLLVLGSLAAAGIREAVWVAVLVTVLEVAGLIAVVGLGLVNLEQLSFDGFRSGPTPGVLAVLAGAHLAFYAFIGFEDMVNLAEEVKRPEINLPRGIILAVTGASVLYLGVSLVAVTALPLDTLKASDAPLSDLVIRFGLPGGLISLIGILAIVNGALVQLVMASRVLYGMARQGLTWQVFGRLEKRSRTPVIATGVMTGVIAVLTVSAPLESLAGAAASVALILFSVMNLALLRVRHRPCVFYRHG